MKRTLILLSLLVLPLQTAAAAEIRAAVRGGAFTTGDAVGTIELDVRAGSWSLAPAYEVIRAGYGVHAVHVDARRLFLSPKRTSWIGAGPTLVSTNSGSSVKTWNADAGVSWRTKGRWEPFVAGRYYSYRAPVFRDEVEEKGVVLSAGVSFRLY